MRGALANNIMEQALRYILPIYIFFLFNLTFVWRLYVVWKKTGINAFVLKEKKGLESFIIILSIFISLTILMVVLVHSFAPHCYPSFYEIKWLQNNIIVYTGLALLTLSLFWMIIAQAQMGSSWRIGIDNKKKTELVTFGVFKYSRNPIYLGARLILLGIFLVLPNAVTLTILLLSDALTRLQVSLEEKHLECLHGEQYRQYCRQVRRWI